MMNNVESPTRYSTEYRSTNIGDDNQNNEKTTATAGNVFEYIANAVDNIASNLSMHRLVVIIALIGYILIAFRGFMNDWVSVIRYSVFIIFLLFLFAIIFFVKYYLKNIEIFFIDIRKFFTSKIRKIFWIIFLCAAIIYYIFLSIC